jgi:tetratricopeptide (TPR) repeat protein
MRSRWARLFVLMHIAGLSGPATAQTPDQQACSAPDPDLSISGCTAMIQSGHETQQDLAVTFVKRGIAYARKGQGDRAIEDYDQAIRLDPNYAIAFYNRGLAYKGKGQPDRAIADYDQAIQLDPDYAAAFSNRGTVYSGKGQAELYSDDHALVILLDPQIALAFYNRGNAYSR